MSRRKQPAEGKHFQIQTVADASIHPKNPRFSKHPMCPFQRRACSNTQTNSLVLRWTSFQEQHRQRPIRPIPPNGHGLLLPTAPPGPLAAQPRLRFGPFLPGRPLPLSCAGGGGDGSSGEEAIAPSSAALFQRHRPPTQTDRGLHLRRRLGEFSFGVGRRDGRV